MSGRAKERSKQEPKGKKRPPFPWTRRKQKKQQQEMNEHSVHTKHVANASQPGAPGCWESVAAWNRAHSAKPSSSCAWLAGTYDWSPHTCPFSSPQRRAINSAPVLSAAVLFNPKPQRRRSWPLILFLFGFPKVNWQVGEVSLSQTRSLAFPRTTSSSTPIQSCPEAGTLGEQPGVCPPGLQEVPWGLSW